MSCCNNYGNGDCCTFEVNFGIVTEIEKGVEYYEGSYEFTPSQSEQIISIAKQTAKQNITINPIPKNYGKVSQIGNELTIE